MGVVDALLKVRAPRASETDRIAGALGADPAAGLAQLLRWLESPAHRDASPEARLDALEALRARWRDALAPLLAGLRNRPIPLDAAELSTLHRAGRVLRALRDAHLSIHDALRGPGSDAGPSPRAALALARALDAQSRLLVAACRLRVALPREDWDAACRIALALRTASTPDGSPPSESAPVHAALALPLLLRLVEPLGLPAAQFDAAAALARRAAREVGLRIDVGDLPRARPDGPSLRLSAHHGVRLDTRVALERLRRVRERLARGEGPSSLGLRTPLSAAALDALLASLATVWGPRHVPTPLGRPPLRCALLHVGLPRRARSGEAWPAAPAPTAAAGSARAPSPYVYGRAGGAAPAAGALRSGPTQADIEASRELAVRATMAAAADEVEWRGQDARRAVFSRVAGTPRLRLGQLVAVLPVRPIDRADRRAGARPAARPMPLRLGRVVTLAQTGVADGREPFAHDVGVAFWPDAAVPVRVRFDGSTAFESAWWMPAAAGGAPGSLVVRRDRFEAPCDVVIREAARDVELRVRRLLERGPDFDRLELGPIG